MSNEFHSKNPKYSKNTAVGWSTCRPDFIFHYGTTYSTMLVTGYSTMGVRRTRSGRRERIASRAGWGRRRVTAKSQLQRWAISAPEVEQRPFTYAIFYRLLVRPYHSYRHMPTPVHVASLKFTPMTVNLLKLSLLVIIISSSLLPNPKSSSGCSHTR